MMASMPSFGGTDVEAVLDGDESRKLDGAVNEHFRQRPARERTELETVA